MVAPTGNNLRLTRKEIEDVVGKSPRAVKQFESLFRGFNGASPTYTARSVDANTGIEDGDFLFDVDASAGAVSIQLPSASAAEGRELVGKLVDASGNGFTFLPDGADLIDGAASLSITTQWGFVGILSNGTAWRVVR